MKTIAQKTSYSLRYIVRTRWNQSTQNFVVLWGKRLLNGIISNLVFDTIDADTDSGGRDALGENR